MAYLFLFLCMAPMPNRALLPRKLFQVFGPCGIDYKLTGGDLFDVLELHLKRGLSNSISRGSRTCRKSDFQGSMVDVANLILAKYPATSITRVWVGCNL
jgi:hypothetical protein